MAAGIFCASLLVLSVQNAEAQVVIPTQSTDTLVVALPQAEPAIDSTLAGVSIFYLLDSDNGGKTVVNQPASTAEAFNKYVSDNQQRKRNGYRILVYSNNAQSARAGSADVSKKLKTSYPLEKVYRVYSAPFFTVHVGNFRTKNDAMRLYKELLPICPQAKIVKSAIDWYSF